MTPSSASASVATTRARAARRSRRWPSRSPPRAAARRRSAARTSTRSRKPITFIARAAAPTLPAWLVPTRTKRVGSVGHRARPLKLRLLILRRACARPALSAARPPLDTPARPMSQALHPMLNIAVKAARAAGAIINRASLDLDLLQGQHQVRRTTSSPRSTTPPRRPSSTRCSPPIPATASWPRSRAATHGAQGQRLRLDHRPARRHHQLHPRLPGLRGVDRAGASRPGAAGGRLRPGAQRPVLRHQGPRRLPQRQAAARLQAHAHGRCADRHRLSVPQGRQFQALPADVRGGDAELRRPAPAGRRGARPVLRRRRLVRRLLRDRPDRPGTSPPAR